MKKMMTRALSAALALTMCVGLLNIPAFAATAEVLTCGTPEHSHTSACYATNSVLTCTESTEDQVVTETVTTTVVDEETGEETVVTQEVTKVIPGHTHGAGCYSEESVLTCTAAVHTHSSSCYSEETRDVEVDEDEGTVTVTPPSEFTAETKGEDGSTISTQVKVEDGKATVTVDGKEIEATVKTEVTSGPVNTTVGSQTGETTSEVTDRVTNADGSVTVYTEYTTTYTTEVTTGYWVTYTVTYTEPTTYTVEKDDGLNVTVDENGNITVNGVGGDTVKDDYNVTVNGVIGEGEKIGNYSIMSEGGKFYVTIDGQKYEVLPTVGRVNGEDDHYIVSWSFADDNTKIEIADGTQEKALPEGVKIDEKGNVTLTDNVTIDENRFVVEDGKTYIEVNGLKYEVTLTASGDATNGYTLDWNYKVDNLPAGSVEDITFDENGISNAVNGIWEANGPCEFAAIVLPDGTYHEASKGFTGDKGWLTTADAGDVWVTTDGSMITIHYSIDGKADEKASFPCNSLDGYTITDVTYSCEIKETGEGYRYLIVNINGITVQDEDGNEVDKTLTVYPDIKGLTVTATTQTGNAMVGGTETKYVTISSLTGGAHVVVTTQDGKEVEMTYREYLEAKAEGEDLELKGVLESSIPPQPTPPSGGEPVIPVIPPVVIEDPDVPLVDLPEDLTEIEDEDVPLTDLPEDLTEDKDAPLPDEPDEIEIDDGDVPLSDLPDLPDEIMIDDGEVPLADVPQTGDISSMWYVVSVLSAAGFLVLTVLERRQRRQA